MLILYVNIVLSSSSFVRITCLFYIPPTIYIYFVTFIIIVVIVVDCIFYVVADICVCFVFCICCHSPFDLYLYNFVQSLNISLLALER